MKKNILITETNADIRLLYEAIFAPFRVQIFFTDTSDETSETLHTNNFTLLVLELTETEKSSKLTFLLHSAPECPVIFITTVPADSETKRVLLEKPNRAIFMKPFDITKLRETIQQFLAINTSTSSIGKDPSLPEEISYQMAI